MNRYAFSTFGAALLAAALGARPAAAQTAVSRCDRAMADAEILARNVSDCFEVLAASRAALSQALSGVNGGPRSAPASSAPTVTEHDVDATPPALRERLVTYYSALAFASGDSASCDAIKFIGADVDCRHEVLDLRFWRDRMGPTPEMLKSCRLDDYADAKNPKAVDEMMVCCTQIAESREHPNCAQLARCFPAAANCQSFFGSLRGDASACDQLQMRPGDGCSNPAECKKLLDEDRATCRATALYAKAFRAKDPAVCGGSESCRVLMGEGKQVSREIAAKSLQNPVGQWFLKGGYKVPFVVPQTRLAAGKPGTPRAGSVPYSAPKGGPVAQSKKLLDFKGFVCRQPLRAVENRSAAAAVIKTAQACLAEIEKSLPQDSRALADEIDAREEKLARMSLKVTELFDVAAPGADGAGKAAKKTAAPKAARQP